ncbi:MAG TPA: sigma-70 family RNA polymerase sigma factor [Steroidobacteraceae bacterium]|nr:sigma-70 family RNA polymerase sigma factor [Steroidobacteraceae bacterium]
METTASFYWLPVLAAVSPTHAMPTTSDVTDESLMLRFRNGDDLAFRLLYQRYRAPLMRFCQHLTGRVQDAEEIFQETWIALIDARARYSVRARFVTFLFSIAHRRAADGWRKRVRHPTAPWSEVSSDDEPRAGDEFDPPGAALADEQQHALEAAIAALPVEQRVVFLLRAETGLGVREIAAITHCRPETAKSRLRYALRHLREALAPWH